MTAGGVSDVEFGSVKCTIKRSDSPVVQARRRRRRGVLTGSTGPCVWSQKGPLPDTFRLSCTISSKQAGRRRACAGQTLRRLIGLSYLRNFGSITEMTNTPLYDNVVH